MNAPLRLLTPRARTVLVMTVAICAVTGLGLWDAHQQSARAIEELMRAHRLVALALAMNALPEPTRQESAAKREYTEYGYDASELRHAALELEAESGVVVLVSPPFQRHFLRSDGRKFFIPELQKAFLEGSSGVTLPPERAHEVGLPQRVAVAGIATGRSSARAIVSEHKRSAGALAIAVLGSAALERDRIARAEWRTILTVFFVSASILSFGFFALRRQREELSRAQREAVHTTERQRDAELARANRMAAVAALSSGIAHEIATPLGIISGRIEQLQAEVQQEERQARALATISAQVDRIDKVMRGFLALARGDAPTLEHTSAAQIAQDAARLVEHRFAAAEVDLRIDTQSAGNATVACEPLLFSQVLVNLLTNALEASTRGELVELWVKREAERVRFIVLDQGVGISKTALTRATEPFFSTKTTSGGTGLGLAIVREIVSHHGGELVLERRQDEVDTQVRGTRVVVQLPIANKEPNVS